MTQQPPSFSAAGLPSSASALDPPPSHVAATSLNKPHPLVSITASARRLSEADFSGRSYRTSTKEEWQDDAWDMLDLVGEQRFLANTLAGRMSQARMYVGIMPTTPTDQPEPATDASLQDLLDEIGSGELGLSQIMQRLGVNLFVTGDAWIGGVPSALIPSAHRIKEARLDYDPNEPPLLEDLEWRTFSISEVSSSAGGQVTLRYGPTSDDEVTTSPEAIYLIRVWRSHPRRAWEADSPTRSSLPVLREIVGLTMHIGAQVDSRLAGAGLLLVPQSASEAIKRAAGLNPEDVADPFTDALIEAMLTPINDRAAASALVPLVVTVPDETIALFKHMSFDRPLDALAAGLRDESIRRLALGQDAPPELLLGSAGMNHWGAWLVREDVVTTHIEPPLALICDALTTQYLWPLLMQTRDWTAEQAEQYVVWYDVSHMIVRPNRTTDALNLFDRGAISAATLREASGFDESDAPDAADATDTAAPLGSPTSEESTPEPVEGDLPVTAEDDTPVQPGQPPGLSAAAMPDAEHLAAALERAYANASIWSEANR